MLVRERQKKGLRCNLAFLFLVNRDNTNYTCELRVESEGGKYSNMKTGGFVYR